MMRSIKIVEPNSLEKLVKRKSTKCMKKEMPLPIQKNIDLKDPLLKKKGIKERIKEPKVENTKTRKKREELSLNASKAIKKEQITTKLIFN